MMDVRGVMWRIILYPIAAVIFVIEWASEQPAALHIAWLRTFAAIPDYLAKIRRLKQPHD